MELYIRIQSHAVNHKFIARRKTKLLARRKLHRVFLRSRKRVIRYSLLTANLALLVVVIFFVAKSPAGSQAVHQSALAGVASSDAVAGPLDQVSSADIAVHIARLTGLPEATSVVNHADSVSAVEAAAPADTSVVAKPQVVSTALPSRKDIRTYTTVAGDTISSVASKFGVSSDSIKWSNNLTSNIIAAGRVLTLPPAGVEGIVYAVQPGDTPDKLAQKYSADKDLLISFNDAEVGGLKPGERILIPNGIVTAVATTVSYNYFALSGGGGGYDRGWCTDYASRKGGAPGGWGNANTWAFFAARTPGWTVSKTPKPGAIAQTSSGWAGHVGIVDAVSEDGTMIKYSDMNGLAGWGRVGYSDWVPTLSAFQNFIYRN